MNKNAFAELVRYGITGVSTTLVNLGIYHGLLLAGLDYKLANLVALIGSKSYGYIVNKRFVFRSHCSNKKDLLKEIIRFALARGFTAAIDYFGLIIAVDAIGMDRIISKYLIQFIVITVNYFLGKRMVFNRSINEREGESHTDAV